jgi:hypothetical protein
VDEMALNNEDFSFLIDLEMYVNAEAGDRHLSEYVKDEETSAKMDVSSKTE